MVTSRFKSTTLIQWAIIALIFITLFILPVLFTRINGAISWLHVVKIWKDLLLLIPLFAINHWFLVPKILLRKKYVTYFLGVAGLIALFSWTYYYHDEVLNKQPVTKEIEANRPSPIPPYANLLMYSLLIVGVDTGLLFSRQWYETEEKRNRLEKENAEIQLNILRNQISPHFFMNTLNNIYALIDCNSQTAKGAVMKLSKLMRYILYETETGKVKLSKEFEFIKSYIDLMKLRFADEMTIQLNLPTQYVDVDIPPMLFISYVENAFKYGASYQNESFINIQFEIKENLLHFNCCNSKYAEVNAISSGGLGMKNNENRLKLLYGSDYSLEVNSTNKIFNVSLAIPLS